jgi:transposase
MRPPYSQAFREKMVQRMLGPKALTATELSKEVGIPQPTLSKWLREAHLRAMGTTTTAPERPAASPGARTAEEKFRLVLAAEALGAEELGGFLRREGLHESELATWREAMKQALGTRPAAASAARPADTKRIKELERELRRKDKALAETAALLVLAKKAEALWGDVDDGTDEQSAR